MPNQPQGGRRAVPGEVAADRGSGARAAARRHQQLVEWNATATELDDRTLPELFQAQVARTPDAVALVWDRERLTYAELNRRANRLAHRLGELGVGPETPVAIRLERCPTLVTAVLAVLKAGGAYVPLDPLYPGARTAMILADVEAAVLLTTAREVASLPPTAAQVVCVDRDRDAIARCPQSAPDAPADPAALAYLIYTSGSTGRPKGVAITHRSAVNLVRWAHETFTPDELAGMLASTSINFDLSVFELFVPLALGGKVLLARNALELPALPAAAEVTFVNTVPSAIAELVRSGPLSASVRTVGLAGEALRRELADRVCRQPGVRQVWNLYGPSETTTYSTAAPVVRDADEPPAIGRPVANTRVYLLDPRLQPLPAGEVGELYLGGAGLARGYLRQPARTAEAFLADPFAAEPGARMYRTGDLARFRPDGSLHFLGRRDHQVKIRGYRIELGEIETALDRHPAVGAVAVLARQDQPGDPRLVAYLTSVGPPPAVSALRAWLEPSLPAYMVPQAFVFLDRMPLTPSGKIDRRSLPAPGAGRPALATPYVAPRGEMEAALAAIWSEVLGHLSFDPPSIPPYDKGGRPRPSQGQVGVDDDFFELGGHSLLATQVLSRVRRKFGVELPMGRLFEAPTVAALAARVEAARQLPSRPRLPPPAPVPRDQPLPLSFAQQRLWFLDRMSPGSPVYNIPAAFRIAGRLGVATLARSLDAIVARHEVLRTTFVVARDEPEQVVAPPSSEPLPVVDLGRLKAPERPATARRLTAEQARRPFDMERGPLLRRLLLRLDAEEHWLLLTMHHVVSDGWSLDVLIGELQALYGAYRDGRASPLPPLPIQYADFAHWQRRWLNDETLAPQLAYWRQQLAGAPRVLELPTDRPRPPLQSHRGASAQVRMPAALSAAVQELSRKQGVTRFMTLLAGFALLLGRHTGERDLLVGSPIANRNRAEIENLIGFFVNTLVLRCDLGGGPSRSGPTFRELLARIRETTLAAYAHQDLPFDRLVEELQPQRELARSPLVQVMFALWNAPAWAAPGTAPGGLMPEPLAVDPGTAKFDLTLILEDADGGLVATIERATDFFDATTALRLVGHFRVLLREAMADPERRLWDLPILAASERHQLIGAWNDTTTGHPRAASIQELFEAQVEQTPEAVAVVFGDQKVTYRELNRRANALAHHLRARQVGPEAVVGILSERSLAMVVGILGILKAGGAYLPLDAGYPGDRLAFMRRDAGCCALLTREHLRERLGKGAGRTVCLDDGGWAPGSEDNPPHRVRAENLAYVIYTSGSTGRPKGTELTHAGLLNLVAWHQRLYRVTAADRATQLAGPGFDAAVWELWPYLTAGAAIHIPEPEVVADPAQLVAWLASEGITLCFLPTPLAEAVLAVPLPPHLRLRALLTGGDRLHHHPARPLPFTLLNHYGPTESTVVTTSAVVPRRRPGGGPPPIGRALANIRVYLLDAALHPVPIGVAGELHVAGTGLARGYLRRPRLTASRFVPCPFSGEPGGRLYRTGDLARYLPDGAIDFLGRIDHQVKIRGFRIELGEIEAVLGRHPAVREAAVLVRQDHPAGERRLVAYVVPGKKGGDPDLGALRAELGETLPEYMVPAVLVELPALPLTPNGKVDRTALGRMALPDESGFGAQAEYVAPRTPAEELLAGIWAEVLGGRERALRIGVHDNFFARGGHSLVATQVVSRVRRLLGTELAVHDLFAAPTVAELAACLDQVRVGEGAALPPPLRPVPRGGGLPTSFAQQRLWLLDRMTPGSPVYNVPAAWGIEGPLAVAVLARGLGALVARHEALRTRFVEQAGPVQLIGEPAPAALPVVDLTALPRGTRPAVAHRLTTDEAQRPFDLTRGPLLRANLLRLGAAEHRLLLVMHHIVSDGWSMRVLVRELRALYRASAAGRGSPLPPLVVQYADFAHWQRRWLRGEVMAAQVAYWRKQLAGAPEVLELPTDRPRPPIESFRGASHRLSLPGELGAAVRRLSQGEGVTRFMTLLAAFAILLGRCSGQRDLLVGSPVANRNRAEIEGLIGFFVNTLVLRCDLRGEPSFRRLLARVRQTALDAYAHQDLPFDKLVEELQPRRDLSRSPLFQVVFTLDNTPGRATATSAEGVELPLTPLPVDTGTAKFDLTLILEETPEGLTGTLERACDLFDATTVQRLAGHYRVLLAAAVADPERAVWELPLLSPVESHQVTAAWNDTRSDAPRDAVIDQLFAAQAERTPDAVAVAFQDQKLTYRELDRRANRLAHHLRSLGVGPEELVALSAERSPETIVGILGILKAGGAYLPLDAGYPDERLAFMLQDAAVRVLLTHRGSGAERLAGPAARPPELHLVCLDRDWPEISRHRPQPPPRRATAENLAYAMYTSGSTGRPKGVAVRHRSIVRLVREADYAVLDERQVVLQLAPISFDASTLELWGPLVNGGRLAVLPSATPSLGELGAALARHRVTTLWLTAGLFHQMVDENPQGLAGVRQLLAGGDVLSARHVRKALEVLAGGMLVNGYGPTENTTFTCCARLRDPGAVSDPVSIGRPIAGTVVYVLDRQLRPLPAGVPGELLTGGDGVARGYLNRPRLTAERFVPSPFGEPGARLYRTGDLVRFRHDGTIEFLGRWDQQVKVRGFRIELGEVEAALGQYPEVREAVVVARGERLVAWIVWRGEPAAAADLRDFLGRTLPDYMVPSAFVPLAELPLTPNGKVDRTDLARRSLPALAGTTPPAARVAPRGPVEEAVVAIWAEVLEVDPEAVGVHDDFFELGGHSLVAAQVIARVRTIFGLELPLRCLFEQPTAAALAANVSAAGAVPAPVLAPAPRDGRLPLSHGQQRLWFLDCLAPGDPTFNMPFAVRLSGPLDRSALKRSLGEIVRRHEALRTTIATHRGKPYQAIAAPPPPRLPLVDLRRPGPEGRATAVERIKAAEARRPFDLRRGPLLRTTLLRPENQEHLLLVTLHHIVGDGWSLEVLLGELRALYEAYSAGQPSPLPELVVQYADWAAWQRSWLRGEALAAQLAYWRRRLRGPLPELDLPADGPRRRAGAVRGAICELPLGAELAAALRRVSREAGATLFMTLLAAFDVLLHRHTGATDLLVGTPVANRSREESEGLIGFFVNTLVLRSDLSGDPTFRELLARVREVALGAYAHADLPFEQLVAEVQPERGASRTPLFRVMMTLEPAFAEVRRAGRLELVPEEVHSGTSQFDLTLVVTDKGHELIAALEYDCDLFAPATATSWLRHYRNLLAAIVADPQTRLSQLALAGPGETVRQGGAAARTATPAPSPREPARGTRLAARRERLSAAQRAQLEARLKRRTRTPTRRRTEE